MSRIFVLAVVLAVAAVSAAIPELWALSQAYLNEGRGLHPFLCGGLTVGLVGIVLLLVGMLLNDPRR